MQKREVYYELYVKGQLMTEGTYEHCYEEYLRCPSDECAEIFKVTLFEERVF